MTTLHNGQSVVVCARNTYTTQVHLVRLQTRYNNYGNRSTNITAWGGHTQAMWCNEYMTLVWMREYRTLPTMKRGSNSVVQQS